MKSALQSAHQFRSKDIELAIVDRGYRGAKKKVEIEVLLPSAPLKRDNKYQRQKKRILCRKRAAIEPIIGHLKHDYRLSKNWLKGSQGDAINLLMAACAWNLRKWMVAFLVFDKSEQNWLIMLFSAQPKHKIVFTIVRLTNNMSI